MRPDAVLHDDSSSTAIKSYEGEPTVFEIPHPT